MVPALISPNLAFGIVFGVFVVALVILVVVVVVWSVRRDRSGRAAWKQRRQADDRVSTHHKR